MVEKLVFSKREVDFLTSAAKLMAANGNIGLEYRGLIGDIAGDLGVTYNTAETYRRGISEKHPGSLCELVANFREELDTNAIAYEERFGEFRVKQLVEKLKGEFGDTLSARAIQVLGTMYEVMYEAHGDLNTGVHNEVLLREGIPRKTLEVYVTRATKCFSANNIQQALTALDIVAKRVGFESISDLGNSLNNRRAGDSSLFSYA